MIGRPRARGAPLREANVSEPAERTRWIDSRATCQSDLRPLCAVPRHLEAALYQLTSDVERVRSIRGEGLGLATVLHLAEQHGGQVLVDSREGVGSTFTLRLPLLGQLAN